MIIFIHRLSSRLAGKQVHWWIFVW